MVTVSESESAQITNTPVQGTVSRELSVMEVGAPWMVPGLNGGSALCPVGVSEKDKGLAMIWIGDRGAKPAQDT